MHWRNLEARRDLEIREKVWSRSVGPRINKRAAESLRNSGKETLYAARWDENRARSSRGFPRRNSVSTWAVVSRECHGSQGHLVNHSSSPRKARDTTEKWACPERGNITATAIDSACSM